MEQLRIQPCACKDDVDVWQQCQKSRYRICFVVVLLLFFNYYFNFFFPGLWLDKELEKIFKSKQQNVS